MAISDLVREIAYLQGGGKPQGQSDLDKINQTFKTIGGIADNRRKLAQEALAQKSQELQTQNQQLQLQGNQMAIERAKNEEVPLGKQYPQIANNTAGTEGINGTIENQSDINTQPQSLFNIPLKDMTLDQFAKLAEVQKNLNSMNLDKQIQLMMLKGQNNLNTFKQQEDIKNQSEINKENRMEQMKTREDERKIKAANEKEKPKASAILNNTLTDIDNSISDINSLLKDKEGIKEGTGVLGVINRRIPGSTGYNFNANLESLKARNMLSKMADMKALSSNGSTGLGALSDNEGNALRSFQAASDSGQSAEQLTANLIKLRDRLEQSKANLKDGFNNRFGSASTGIPQLMIDANGNKAYVYPDGTIHEVK